GLDLRVTPPGRRGDVAADDLVRALRLVQRPLRGWIPRVPEVLELHPLHRPTVPHVEAGYDARQEPRLRALARRSGRGGRGGLRPGEPALQQRRPVGPGQLRVELAG